MDFNADKDMKTEPCSHQVTKAFEHGAQATSITHNAFYSSLPKTLAYN